MAAGERAARARLVGDARQRIGPRVVGLGRVLAELSPDLVHLLCPGIPGLELLGGEVDAREEQLPDLEAGVRNPFEVADALLARSGDLLTRTTT